ncbi:hypothetical protein QF047_000285 [Arthrobacter sp. W4I7]|nr:hypothetical protein [Arthrobacter sp. W4I7]
MSGVSLGVSTGSTTGVSTGSTTGVSLGVSLPNRPLPSQARPGNPAVVGPGSTTGDYCGHCGEPSDGGGGPPSDVHQRCGERLAMEPPRYCATCRRRMKVQVAPLGWTAECSRHGVIAS